MSESLEQWDPLLQAMYRANLCPDCKGSGMVWVQVKYDARTSAECPKCKGTGKGEVAIQRVMSGEADKDRKPEAGNFKYKRFM